MNRYELKALIAALGGDVKDTFEQSGLTVEHGELCARGLFLLIQANSLASDRRQAFIEDLKAKGIGLHEDAAFEAFAEVVGTPVDEVGAYYIQTWKTGGWKTDLKALGGELPSEALMRDISEKSKELSAMGQAAAQQGAAFAQKTGAGLLRLVKSKGLRIGAIAIVIVSGIGGGGVVMWPRISDMIAEAKMAKAVLSVEEGSAPITLMERNALDKDEISPFMIRDWRDIARLYLSWEGVLNKHVEALASGLACGGHADEKRARSELQALAAQNTSPLPRDTLVALPVMIEVRYNELSGGWALQPLLLESMAMDVFGGIHCDAKQGTTVVAKHYQFRFADGASESWLMDGPIVPEGFTLFGNDATVLGQLLARIEANTAKDEKGLTRDITLIPIALRGFSGSSSGGEYVLWSGRLERPEDKKAAVSADSKGAVSQAEARKDTQATSRTVPETTQKNTPSTPEPQSVTASRQPSAPPSISGTATVIDTATVVVAGETLRLVGVKAVPHPGAVAGFRSYLDQAGQLECVPVGSEYACKVMAKGHDLSEVLALSGFATALPGAPSAVLDAEEEAKRNKAGVWRK